MTPWRCLLRLHDYEHFVPLWITLPGGSQVPYPQICQKCSRCERVRRLL